MSSRFAFGLLALFAASAGAQTPLTATLTNDQETTPVVPTTSNGVPRPVSFGEATFTINAAMTSMTFSATVNNIDFTGSQTPDTFDNLLAAHIHAPAPPGINAGVVWGFFGVPLNDTNPMNTIFTPFATGVGGTVVGTWDQFEGNQGTTFTAQLGNILAGLSYINFHTVQFGGGEVRGQILAVPEPATYALLLAGLSILGACSRRPTRRASASAASAA